MNIVISHLASADEIKNPYNVKQLKSILACNEVSSVAPPLSLSLDDLDLINPSRWSLLKDLF